MTALHKVDIRVCCYCKCASKDPEPFLPENWKVSRLHHRIWILCCALQDLHFIFYNWYRMCWLTLPNGQLLGIVYETHFTFVGGEIGPAQLPTISNTGQ